MAKANLNVPGNYQRAAFGQNGFDYLTGNPANLEGDFVAVQALVDSVVTIISSEGDNLVNVTIAKGLTIYGPFTAIDLASGSVLAYRA